MASVQAIRPADENPATKDTDHDNMTTRPHTRDAPTAEEHAAHAVRLAHAALRP